MQMGIPMDEALTILEGLACPKAVMIAIMIRQGMWLEAAQAKALPHHYADPEAYFAANAAVCLLKKCKDLPIKVDRREAALTKWWEAEKRCFLTNRRLYPFVDNSYLEVDVGLAAFIKRARAKVWSVLGSKSPRTLELRLGPGATQSDKSGFTTVPDKFTSPLTLTQGAWIHLPSWLECAWGQAHVSLGLEGREVRGNAYFTVDKTALTDRSCAKEPSLNGAAQLAVGSELRWRLRRYAGIDLDHGHLLHQKLACEGSLLGNWCTLDLSSASDTVASSLVELLLPPEWFSLLSSLRSPFTEVDGKQVRLEKFSSMGNGFTFELETLIFWAICSASMPDAFAYHAYVYGDDIVVPTEFARDVVSALEFFGFELNRDKSFTDGVFRESCGGDFFLGVGVRPYYIEELPSEPQHWIGIANGIRRMAFGHNCDSSRWLSLRRSWFRILDYLPTNVRSCRGPEILGDIVVHDDSSRWTTKWRSSCIRYVRVYRPVARSRVLWERFAYDVQRAAALYLAGKGQRGPTRDPLGNLVPRDPVVSYKIGWVPFS